MTISCGVINVKEEKTKHATVPLENGDTNICFNIFVKIKAAEQGPFPSSAPSFIMNHRVEAAILA